MPNTHETLGSLFSDIADAIREKEGTVVDSEGHGLIVADDFPSRIEAISTGIDISDTTATAADVLEGAYFYEADGTKTEGSIVSNGATGGTISTQGGTYSIPTGYTTGGTVTANINAVSGSIGGSASAGSATAAIDNTDSMRTVVSPSGTAGTDYFRVKATASGSAGSYTPEYTVSTAGYINSTVMGSAQSVSVTSDSVGQTINIPKATFTVDGDSVKTSSTGGGYIGDNTTVGTVSSMTLPTAAAASADGTNKATITAGNSDQYINIPIGYNSAKGSYKINAMASMTLPTSTSSTSIGSQAAAITVSGSDQYINIPTGYNSDAAYYKINAVQAYDGTVIVNS